MLPALRKNISEFQVPQIHEASAIEANAFAINHYALALSSKICDIDGDINLSEKRAFISLFPYFGQDGIALLKNTVDEGISTYHACRRFSKFANEDKSTTARLYARLFKLAGCDDTMNVYEISFLEKLAPMLGLHLGFLEKALEYYFLNNLKHQQKFTPRDELRKFYLTQISRLHPDNFAGDDILSKRIKSTIISLANERTKLLNENYKNSVS